MDMFYIYVISGFNITNSESRWNIKFVFFFKIYKPTLFIFGPPILRIHPLYWQTFWPNPFYKCEISLTHPFLKVWLHTSLFLKCPVSKYLSHDVDVTSYLDRGDLGKYCYSKLDPILQFLTIITLTKANGHIAHIATNFHMTPVCLASLM